MRILAKCFRCSQINFGSVKIDTGCGICSCRIWKAAVLGIVDFFSISHLCSLISKESMEYESDAPTRWLVNSLSTFAERMFHQARLSSFQRSLQALDALLSVLLQHESFTTFDDTSYLKFLYEFGENVLLRVFCNDSNRDSVRRLNVEPLMIECFTNWKDLIDVDFRQHVIETSAGWSLLDKYSHKRDSMREVPAVLPHTDQIGLYDFGPVALRSPIYIFHTQKSYGQQVAATPSGSEPPREISKVHVSFFRYLIAKKEFARHIVTIINAHNIQASNTSLNDSNLTVINNSPVGRRGSLDSLASYLSTVGDTSGVSMNSFLDLFSVHCKNFFGAFGAGIMQQISNDLVSGMMDPPNDFLRLMISLSPLKASSDAHSAVRKYISAQLVGSLRNLVHNRNDQTSVEDCCLSFLMKAEMSVVGKKRWLDEYRVVCALISSVLNFTICESEIRIEKLEKHFLSKIRFKSILQQERSILLWMEYFTKSDGGSVLINSIINSNEGKKELGLIYREIAAANVSVDSHWESELSRRVNCCKRLIRSDVRLLMTSSNGLGITPVEVSVNDESRSQLSFVMRSSTSSPSKSVEEEIGGGQIQMILSEISKIRKDVDHVLKDRIIERDDPIDENTEPPPQIDAKRKSPGKSFLPQIRLK